jgi:hypothetical protein
MTLASRLILVACLWILASPTSLVAQIQDPTERAGGSTVRGTAIYADTGRPIRNAGVRMISDVNALRGRNVVTNGRGEFVVKDVAAGRYILHVDAPGILMPSNYDRQTGSITAQLRLHEKRDLFTEVVLNGTETVEVKVQGVRGGVITGRVVTEDDQPVADADVKLFRRVNDKWVAVDVPWFEASNKHIRKTDPSGVYRIAGLESGEYIVRVSEPSIAYDKYAHTEDAYSNGSQMVALYPSATNVKDAQTVSVIEGSESSGIDIRMPERIPRTISGTVTHGPNDQPAGFVAVLIERRDEQGFNSVMDTNTRSDEKGEWSVKGIPAGEYVVLFSGTVRVGTPGMGGHVYLAPKQVAVTVANDDVALKTRVEAGAVVTGTIKVDGPQPNTFYDFRPAVVLAAEGSEGPPSNQDPGAKRGYELGYVRDLGRFEIRELSTGKYWFLMSGFRPDEYYVKSITRTGVDLAKTPFKVVAGVAFDGVVVTLGTDLATIEGQVSDIKPKTSPRNTKTSASDVVVMLAPASDATRRFSLGLVSLQPDAQGKFVFRCAPGEYFLAAFTRSQLAKLTTTITEDYFKQDNQKFQRVKVRAGERLKEVTVTSEVN